MKFTAQLLNEMLVVGLGFGVLGLIVSTAFMYATPGFSLRKYRFWWQVFLSYAIAGALFHLICEATNINAWYCKNGNACKKQ